MFALLPLFIHNKCVTMAHMYVPYCMIPNQFPMQNSQAGNIVYPYTSMSCPYGIIIFALEL